MANTRNIKTNAQVAGTLDVTGALSSGAATIVGNSTVTGTLGVTGNTTVTGNLNVTGTVSFGAGSTFNDSTFDVHDTGDITKQVKFELAGATTSTATTITASQTANRAVTLPDADTTLVGHNTTQTITNKSIDADNNTISNIENADIKTGAAIERAKLASGTASHVVTNDGSGVMSSEATLAAVRGGMATDASAFTGAVKANAGVFSASAIVNADVDASAAIARSKLAVGTADHVAINNGSGVLSSEAQLAAARGGMATDASAFTGVVKAAAGVFSASAIVNADIDASAAIARSKLAAGSANHVLIHDGSGVMSSEASLAETRGGTAQTSYAAGDTLYASASNTISKRTIGSVGQTLKVDNTGLPAWEDKIDPTQESFLYDDWMGVVGGTLNWTLANAGVGTGITPNSTLVDANHHGIIQLTTGVTSTGRAANFLGGGTTSALTGSIVGGGVTVQEWLIRLEDLATVGEDYTFLVGSVDNASSPSNGIYFRYVRSVSPNWLGTTIAASVTTSLDSGVAVAEDTWVKLKMIINAAGTSVEFFVNGTSVGTNSTNIPSVTIAPVIRLNKAAGTTARLAYADYFKRYQRFTTAR